MVIGGLIRDNVTASTIKVPLLGDIPVLGWLFKFKTAKVEKTNLMIFITPHIIKTAEESAELTRQRENILNEFRKEYHIEKKGNGSHSMLRPADNKGIAQPEVLSAETSAAGAVASSATSTTHAAEAVKSDPATAVSSTPAAEKAATPAEGTR
jgi:Flp pilus assembly secretin CpaC